MPVISQRQRCYVIFKCFFPFLNILQQCVWTNDLWQTKKKKNRIFKCLYMVFPTRLSCVILLFMLLLDILWLFCHCIPFIFSHFHQIKPLCLKNQAASKKSAPVLSFLSPCLPPQTTDPAQKVISLLNFILPLHCPPPPQNKPNKKPQHSPPLPPILSKRACYGVIIEVKDS